MLNEIASTKLIVIQFTPIPINFVSKQLLYNSSLHWKANFYIGIQYKSHTVVNKKINRINIDYRITSEYL